MLIAHKGLSVSNGTNGTLHTDLRVQQPIVNVSLVQARLQIAFRTANRLVDALATMALLEETTGARRNRRFRYTPFVELFEERPQ